MRRAVATAAASLVSLLDLVPRSRADDRRDGVCRRNIDCLAGKCDGGRCICPRGFALNESDGRCRAAAEALRQDALSASHIILMLLGCVLALGICHLVIRLWMRRRESAFLRQHTGPRCRPPPRLSSTDPVLSGALPEPPEEPPPRYDQLVP